MDRDGILALSAYNGYANRLVLDTVEKLTPEQLVQPCSPSHGSVRELLLHMLDCEAFFLAQCQGREVDFEALHGLDIPGLREYWRELEKQLHAHLSSLGTDDLERAVDLRLRDRQYTLPLWQWMAQALVHSIHHRGELSIVLTGLGHPLPTLDILLHFFQESGQVWD